jgi:hypothetical protein
VFVRKLRQKLRTASPEWSYIHTHFGVGYRFAPEPDDGLPTESATDAEGVRGHEAAGDPRDDRGHADERALDPALTA